MRNLSVASFVEGVSIKKVPLKHIKEFTQVRQLKEKQSEKQFSCNDCGKYFRFKGDLKTHLRVHTGEKSFPCTMYGKHYGRKGSLKTHQRVQTDEKQFPCNDC